METSDIIAIISAAIAALSTCAAIMAWHHSKKANALAENANDSAVKANALAEEANKLAEAQYYETYPHFELISIEHIPASFHKYTNRPEGKTEHESLDTNANRKLREWVEEERNALSFRTIGDTEYLLINLIPKEKKLSDYLVDVYLGSLTLTFVNHHRDAQYFAITRSRSTLKYNRSPIYLEPKVLQFPIRRVGGFQTISTNIAYAHCKDQEPSIKNDEFDFGNKIDFLKNPGESGRVFNFLDSAFETKVIDKTGTEQIQTVHLVMTEEGRIDIRIDKESLNNPHMDPK